MSKNISKTVLGIAASAALAAGVVACGGDDGATNGGTGNGVSDALSGKIAIDGSSTVFPFVQAAAELFNEDNPDVRITVGESGTGGGFEKFCAGQTDISDASRPIKDDEEAPICKKAGIGYSQVQVANDGIAVVSNKALKVDCLTTDELKEIWNKGSKNSDYSLYGPGTDSGTFDFFTDKINGEEGVTRDDYESSEDDNQLVQGVAGSENGLGYFGFSYYESNQDKLNLVAVDSGSGCVKPSTETIQDGSYAPLSRPLYMYPAAKAIERPEVKAFMDFILANQTDIATAAKIVPMTDEQATQAKSDLTSAEGTR
jgi:phosphate transport system substrate-binding protein